MRLICLLALAAAACGGKETPPPSGGASGPANAVPTTPDPVEVDYQGTCDHIVKLLAAAGQDVSGYASRCVAEIKRELSKWPVEIAAEATECVKKVSNMDQAKKCDPEKIAADRGVTTPESIRKQKTMEARQFVKKLYDGARAYYMDASAPGSIQPVAPQFPKSAPAITPPLGSCCKEGGKCTPAATHWTNETWVALQFSVDDPHFYSYEYRSDDVLKSFTVSAYGDLDCDGVYSTFQMYGEVTGDGPSGTAGLYKENELE